MSIKTEELKKIEKEIKKAIISIPKFYGDYTQEECFRKILEAKKTQTIELCKKFEDEVKVKVEKLREELCCGYEDCGGHKCYNCKQIDKIFGDIK